MDTLDRSRLALPTVNTGPQPKVTRWEHPDPPTPEKRATEEHNRSVIAGSVHVDEAAHFLEQPASELAAAARARADSPEGRDEARMMAKHELRQRTGVDAILERLAESAPEVVREYKEARDKLQLLSRAVACASAGNDEAETLLFARAVRNEVVNVMLRWHRAKAQLARCAR
jgi:hypothetical protein